MQVTKHILLSLNEVTIAISYHNFCLALKVWETDIYLCKQVGPKQAAK